jgi:hypothetical protein
MVFLGGLTVIFAGSNVVCVTSISRHHRQHLNEKKKAVSLTSNVDNRGVSSANSSSPATNLPLERRIRARSVDYRTNPHTNVVFSGMVVCGELAVFHPGRHERSTERGWMEQAKSV